MAAPSLFDGVSRAVEVLGIPSVALFGIVGGVRLLYGGQEAGIVYVALTLFVLLGIYTAAKHWNTRYTVGFVVAGAGIWAGVPAVVPFLVPSSFATAGRVVVLVFLGLTARRLSDKMG